MGRMLRGAVAVVLIPLLAHAAPPPRPPPTPPPTPPPADVPPPPPPPPPPPVQADCFPACRPGFFCYQGQCRSACNPPCAAGEMCMDNGQCVPGSGEAPPPPPPDDAPVDSGGPPPPGGLMVSDDGEQAPPGYHWETKRRKGMLIAGPVLLGVGWIMSIFYGLFGYVFAGIGLSSSSTSWIVVNRGTYLVYLVPVVGPGAAQLLMATSAGYRDGSGRTLELGWMVVVSALQLSGLALTILGIPTSQVLVEDRARAEGDAKRPDGLRVQWAPAAPGAEVGFSLLGSF